MVNCRAHYKHLTGILTPQSHNVVSVTALGGGLFDIVFAHVSRTGDADKFRIGVDICMNNQGHGSGTVTAIGADTVTVRVQTCNLVGTPTNQNFCCDIEELG